jgi:predicted metalloprotease
MRLDDAPESRNVEDRRGMKPAAAVGGGSVVLLIVGYLLFGNLGDAKKFADKAGGVVNRQNTEVVGEPPADGEKQFAARVMGLTDEVWAEQFPAQFREEYQPPGMVLFSQQVDSGGCGIAPSAVGPFYCPASKKVFLDPTFFRELEGKLGGSAADFSKAYVIAHEVGHHVQNLLGYNELVDKYRRREGENSGIRLELQADYLAGVCWHHAERKRKILERGDIDAAITSAKAIGDDKLAGWGANPEKFNHGTSAQRLKYFKQGLESGDASKRALDRFFDPNVRPLDL